MECARQNIIFVKIGMQGEVVKEFCMNSGATISDVFNIWGRFGKLFPERYELTVNGATTMNLKLPVKNGDLIIIKEQVKPTMINIKIGRVGQLLYNLELPERSTIYDAMNKIAGMTPRLDEEIWLHENENVTPGYRTDTSKILHNGYTVILEKKRDERKCAILRIIAEYYNHEASQLDEWSEMDWEDIPLSYAERIMTVLGIR